MSSVLDEARLRIQGQYREEQIKSLKRYLHRLESAKRKIEENTRIIEKIGEMTEEEFINSEYFRSR